jgi:hypothetical protein
VGHEPAGWRRPGALTGNTCQSIPRCTRHNSMHVLALQDLTRVAPVPAGVVWVTRCLRSSPGVGEVSTEVVAASLTRQPPGSVNRRMSVIAGNVAVLPSVSWKPGTPQNWCEHACTACRRASKVLTDCTPGGPLHPAGCSQLVMPMPTKLCERSCSRAVVPLLQNVGKASRYTPSSVCTDVSAAAPT